MDGIVTSLEFNNLKQDLISVHDTINQIFSKVGVLQSKSWKLRDESSDLPIDMLCNKCQYFSSDLESTRASHIMLLELIIDRLVLMIQSYVYFTDRLVGKPSQRVIDDPPNIGPLCKKYWKRVKVLRQFVTSLQSEVAKKSQELVTQGSTLDKAHEENMLLKDLAVKHGIIGGYDSSPDRHLPPADNDNSAEGRGPPTVRSSVQWSEFSARAESEHPTTPGSVRALPTSITVNNMKTVSKWLVQGAPTTDVKTQTVETAFVECHVCSTIQDMLEAVGSKIGTVSNMLRGEAVPPKRLVLSTAREAMKWCEHNLSVVSGVDACARDIKKTSINLTEQCTYQRETIERLEKEVCGLEKEIRDLQANQLKILTEKARQEEALQRQISKQTVEYTHNFEVRRVEEERLKSTITTLEEKAGHLEQILSNERLEHQKSMEELRKLRDKTDDITKMKSMCSELEERIETLMKERSSVTDELGRYQTQNDQLIKQNKLLSVKQGQLIAQLEAFDQECENMREELEMANDSNANADGELSDVIQQRNELTRENTRLQEAISKIQEDITSLTTKLSARDEKLNDARKLIEEEREKEDVLINYPLLVEGERLPKELNRLVQANNIRILRLEEQNRLLRDNTLQMELKEAHMDPTARPKTQSLWNNKSFKELVKSQHVFERVFTPIDFYDGIEALVDAKSNASRPNTTKTSGGGTERVTSAKTKTQRPTSRPTSHSSKTSYKLTTENLVRVPQNSPKKPVTSSPKKQYNHICSTCGKSFFKNDDLEIHQIYCD